MENVGYWESILLSTLDVEANFSIHRNDLENFF